MKSFTAFLFGCCLCCSAAAQEVEVRTKEALPQAQPLVLADPVPVPEAMGATLLAGIGFLLMFGRRRY